MTTHKHQYHPWECLKYPFSWNEVHFGGSIKPIQIKEHEFIICPEIVLAESQILSISKYDAEINEWSSKEIKINDSIIATQFIKGFQCIIL